MGMLRKKAGLIAVMFLAAAVVAGGCAPKIVGKRKHKKIRNCGCELMQPQQQMADSTFCYDDGFVKTANGL